MIGIIGAMDVEVNNLLDAMEDSERTEWAGMTFCKGVIGGKECVVVKCGIGKVNAAMCAQALIDLFHVDSLLNTGIAGSLNNQLDIGDLVLCTDAVEHDMDVSPLGYELGRVPGFDCLGYSADSVMRKKIKSFLESDAAGRIHCMEGRVVSGDQFIGDGEKKKWLVDTFGGICAEMEGASIAHVAYKNNIPFMIIRAISDKADGSSHVDYPVFEKATAEKMSSILIEMMKSEIL